MPMMAWKKAKKTGSDVAPDNFTVNTQAIVLGFHLFLAQNLTSHFFYPAVALFYQEALPDLIVSVDNIVLEIENFTRLLCQSECH
jgi:hypothetical protein